MMRDALTEEDKQLAIKTIREENAEASMLNGTKSERYYMALLAIWTDVYYSRATHVPASPYEQLRLHVQMGPSTA